MKKNTDLIVAKNNLLFKIVNFFKKIINKRKKKNELDNLENNKDKKKKVYFVEYDLDPSNTDYGDIYVGENKIIRNSPYIKEIVNPIKYTKNMYSKEDKERIIKKYNDLINGKVDIAELNLDEISVISQLAKEELKIRKKA